MKNIFPGYYRPTIKEFSNLWNSCLFVLDANVLLNLYRYSQETSDELIQILKQVSGRLWVPHQAAFEYQKNRLQIIASQIEEYDKIKKLVKDSKDKLQTKLDSLDERHPYIKADYLMKIMQKACAAIEKNLKKLKETHLDLLQNDNLRDALGALLEDKLGLHYSQEELNEVYNLGKERYKQEIPPGYGDKNKEGTNKYGDLILWFQIIDKAKEVNKPIILVTDDRKEDWWTRIRGKIIGPRPELVDEMHSKAGVSFYLYQTNPFMENAKKFLKMQVKKKAIDEVRRIRERDEEFEQAIIETTMDSIKLTDAIKPISDKFSALIMSDDALRAISNITASSIKLTDAIKPISDKFSSLKMSDETLRAIQGIKSLDLNLKKGIEKTEDINLSADFVHKKIDEKDSRKEK